MASLTEAIALCVGIPRGGEILFWAIFTVRFDQSEGVFWEACGCRSCRDHVVIPTSEGTLGGMV